MKSKKMIYVLPMYFILIKNFNTFIYDHTLHCEGQQFCSFCLQGFSTERILKCHKKTALKLMVNKQSKCLKKGEYVKFKNFENKMKSPFYDLWRFRK